MTAWYPRFCYITGFSPVDMAAQALVREAERQAAGCGYPTRRAAARGGQRALARACECLHFTAEARPYVDVIPVKR